MKPDHYHVVASHFADSCGRNPNARVWALLFRGEKLPATMEAALEEYREVETVEVYRARGVLYCRGPCR